MKVYVLKILILELYFQFNTSLRKRLIFFIIQSEKMYPCSLADY
jgi:hypothetical protein